MSGYDFLGFRLGDRLAWQSLLLFLRQEKAVPIHRVCVLGGGGADTCSVSNMPQGGSFALALAQPLPTETKSTEGEKVRQGTETPTFTKHGEKEKVI